MVWDFAGLGLAVWRLHNKRNSSIGNIMARTESIRESYDRNAPGYNEYAILEQEVCRRLLDRVSFCRETPVTVLDLGCGTGVGAAELKKTFPKAQVIGVDLSMGMLSEAGRQSRLRRPLKRVNADMGSLPFSRHSADLVFSNLAVPWLNDPGPFFEEIRRVLKPGGMFLFSMFGPGSLSQLSEASARCKGDIVTNTFPDLLEVGDALSAAGFREPVMDIDLLTLHYPDLGALAAELEATGSALLLKNWSSVTGDLEVLAACWDTMDDGKRFPLDFEITYGTAYGPPEGQPQRTVDGEIATFSVDSLLKSQKLGYD